MADSSVQDTGKSQVSAANIEDLLSRALSNSTGTSSTGVSSKITENFKPSVSSSYSMVSSSPHLYSSGAGMTDSYRYTNSQSKDDSTVIMPSRISCAMSFNENALTSSYDYGTKAIDTSMYRSTTSNSTAANKTPETTDDWVDYQFNRLVTDRKNYLTNNTTTEGRKGRSDSPTNRRMKNVEEIIREYSVSPSRIGGSSTNRTSNRYSTAASERQFRSDWMNRSHNNEYLDSSNSEVEQVRRIGSSVDGKVGDTLENTFNSKCSLNNPRCKGGPGSSNMQLYGSEDYRKTPERNPSDSEVDSKEPLTQQPKDFGEIRSEMADLSYSFQKEKDRLRHLETLIKKTPIGGTSSSTGFYQPRLSNRYSSRFLTDLTDRRAYSTTDYTKYVTSDWRSTSPHRDYIGRTTSSPTYKSFMNPANPRSNNYWSSDYTQMQNTYDAHRGPSTSSHSYDHRDPGKNASSMYRYSSNDISGSKSKLNRSMNAKKDRTSPKTNTGIQQRVKPKNSTRSNNQSRAKGNKVFDQSENRKEFIYDNQEIPLYEKGQNRSSSPDSYEECENSQASQRSSKSKTPSGKYQNYEPMHLGQYCPQQTKSACSSLNTSFLSDPARTPYVGEQNQFTNGHSGNERYNWQTILSNESNPQPQNGGYHERASRTLQPGGHMAPGAKKPSKKMRSRSGGPVSVGQAWAVEMPVRNPACTPVSRAPSRGKKTVRKVLKPKTKKTVRSTSRAKKRIH